MWLINTATLQLEHFIDPEEEGIPYAILSHTWCKNEEVTFQDYTDIEAARKKKPRGFSKIETTCELARSWGLGYAWIDTNCIDKSSSAELSEAINSMYQWYSGATVCFAYLDDVLSRDAKGNKVDSEKLMYAFSRANWFTRGFTLQELIAPRNVVFFDGRWQRFGDKHEFCREISQITTIQKDVLLKSKDIALISVLDRMCWAGNRMTSRTEDVAYCLLGIFDVNMPLIYGEGYKAFQRLQVEIARKYDDASLFSWAACNDVPRRLLPPVYRTHSSFLMERGPFAWSPWEFVAGKQKLASPQSLSLFTINPDEEITRMLGSPASLEVDGRDGVLLQNAFLATEKVPELQRSLWDNIDAFVEHSQECPLWLVLGCANGVLRRPVARTEKGLCFLDDRASLDTALSQRLFTDADIYGMVKLRLTGQNELLHAFAGDEAEWLVTIQRPWKKLPDAIVLPEWRWTAQTQTFKLLSSDLRDRGSIASMHTLGVARWQIPVSVRHDGRRTRHTVDILVYVGRHSKAISGVHFFSQRMFLGCILDNQNAQPRDRLFAEPLRSEIPGISYTDMLVDFDRDLTTLHKTKRNNHAWLPYSTARFEGHRLKARLSLQRSPEQRVGFFSSKRMLTAEIHLFSQIATGEWVPVPFADEPILETPPLNAFAVNDTFTPFLPENV